MLMLQIYKKIYELIKWTCLNNVIGGVKPWNNFYNKWLMEFLLGAYML